MSPDDDLWYVMGWVNEFIQFICAHDGTARVRDILHHVDEHRLFTEEDGYWEGAGIISSTNEFIEYLIARDGEELTNDIMRRIHERALFSEDELGAALDNEHAFDDIIDGACDNGGELPF